MKSGTQMRILVCTKQVLDSDVPIEIDASGRWVRPLSNPLYRMNRFDEYALEEALRLRDTFASVSIDAISAGPLRVAATVRRALEMGANEGIHICLDDEQYRTPFEIASLISAYCYDKRYDLIMAGVMAEDDMQCQVGPLTAELLDYSCATSVIRLRFNPEQDMIYVEREIEGGVREAMEMALPALLTIQSGINRPRYPALSHVLRAKSQPLITVPAEMLQPPTPREHLLCLTRPEGTRGGIILTGLPREKARRLLQLLHEQALL